MSVPGVGHQRKNKKKHRCSSAASSAYYDLGGCIVQNPNPKPQTQLPTTIGPAAFGRRLGRSPVVPLSRERRACDGDAAAQNAQGGHWIAEHEDGGDDDDHLSDSFVVTSRERGGEGTSLTVKLTHVPNGSTDERDPQEVDLYGSRNSGCLIVAP